MKREIDQIIKFFNVLYPLPGSVSISVKANSQQDPNHKLNSGVLAQVDYKLVNNVLSYDFVVTYQDKNFLKKTSFSIDPRVKELSERYNIELNTLLQYDAIFHELIHIEQLISGRMNYTNKSGKIYKLWNNQAIDMDDYENDPSEIEASYGSPLLLEAFLINRR